jgi:uncharacterized protein (TIGR02996 family)
MSEVEAFLAAIREEPDDEAPRLVFADWLDEQNDPRGELIRVQVELARWVPSLSTRLELQNREQELLRQHRRTWLRSLAGLPGTICSFDRGLIDFTTTGAMPIRWNPWIQTLRLRYSPAEGVPLSTYLTRSRLKRLARLDLTGCELSISTIASLVLQQTERLGVKHLRLANNLPMSRTVIPTLPGYPWPGFRSIEWDGTVPFDPNSARDETDTPRRLTPRLLKRLAGTLQTRNQIGMRLKLLPPGEFLMGSLESEGGHDSDEYQHRVEMTEPFFIGVYPVTQREYLRVMESNPSHYQESLGGTPEHPVEQVTWDEAVEFCRRLSEMPEERAAGRVYRLPTEAEWEYACRAGSRTRFSFGDDWRPNQANVMHAFNHTLPVGSFLPNAFGLYDMHGQVREWCQDWYRREYYRQSPMQNPLGPEEGECRVLRGGSWDISSELYARSAYRVYFRPDGRLVGIGFRVVCTISEPADGEEDEPLRSSNTAP